MATKEGKKRTPTKKHQEFVSSPMGSKPVTDVPGIGQAVAVSLEKEGIGTARRLLSHFLDDPSKFVEFVKSHGANRTQAREAHGAMVDYNENFKRDLDETEKKMGYLCLKSPAELGSPASDSD